MDLHYTIYNIINLQSFEGLIIQIMYFHALIITLKNDLQISMKLCMKLPWTWKGLYHETSLAWFQWRGFKSSKLNISYTPVKMDLISRLINKTIAYSHFFFIYSLRHFCFSSEEIRSISSEARAKLGIVIQDDGEFW